MKKWFCVVSILVHYGLAQELPLNRIELSAGYKLGVPTGKMGHLIQQGHGITFQGMFLPWSKIPLWIGGNLDILIYGAHTTPQQYVFPDGSVANVDVNVTSSIISYQLALKYDFPLKTLIEPYAMLRLGGSTFSTTLYIEDPRYDDECVALVNEHLHNDYTFAITPSVGSKIFFSNPKFLFLDFNVGHTWGGAVSFMKPTTGENVNLPPNQHVHTTYSTEAQPYYADFINRNTQVVHKHHVGNIYQSPFQILQLKLGIGIKL